MSLLLLACFVENLILTKQCVSNVIIKAKGKTGLVLIVYQGKEVSMPRDGSRNRVRVTIGL